MDLVFLFQYITFIVELPSLLIKYFKDIIPVLVGHKVESTITAFVQICEYFGENFSHILWGMPSLEARSLQILTWFISVFFKPFEVQFPMLILTFENNFPVVTKLS